MADLQHIIRTIHDLSLDEKLAVRNALDAELGLRPANGNSSQGTSELIGLFAGQDEVLDQVLESVYESRSRPLRVE